MPNATKRRALRKVQARRKVLFAFVRTRESRSDAREDRAARRKRKPEHPENNLGPRDPVHLTGSVGKGGMNPSTPTTTDWR